MAFLSFLAVVVSFVIFARNRHKKMSLIISSIVLFISILIAGVQSYSIKSLVNEIASNSEEVTIYWNKRKIQNNNKFLKAFNNLSSIKIKSGSYPTEKNVVEIIFSNTHFIFSFQKDSRDKNLYWVYFPEYIGKAEIGFVNLKQEIINLP